MRMHILWSFYRDHWIDSRADHDCGHDAALDAQQRMEYLVGIPCFFAP